MLATVLVLGMGKTFKVISFPDFDKSILRKVSKKQFCHVLIRDVLMAGLHCCPEVFSFYVG